MKHGRFAFLALFVLISNPVQARNIFRKVPTVTAPINIAGRAVPRPLYGVTIDDTSNVDGAVTTLRQMAHPATVRLVFDVGQSAKSYADDVQNIHGAAYVMGLIADSQDMPKLSVASAVNRAKQFTQTLGNQVDIWEVGNEVNGNWLGKNTINKIQGMYQTVAEQHGATALTFFYEGEPNEPHNCIAADHDGNDMFSWIADKFQLSKASAQRNAGIEKMRNNLDYVLVSWYPQECPGEVPNWSVVFAKLADIFPNSKVGFGELGTAKPQNGNDFEASLITQYYPMAKNLRLPQSYIGGYFWWYFAEEMIPATKTPLFNLLNNMIR